jgi:predicted DNA-binding transcriptional regulator AlpA
MYQIERFMDKSLATVIPTLLAMPEVEQIVRMKRRTIRRAIETSGFPRPIRPGPKAKTQLFRADEIASWLASSERR